MIVQNCLNVITPRMHADDANNITFSAATIPDLESQIDSDLKYIDRWLKVNKLSLDVAKTEYMVVSLRQKLQSLNDYTMNIQIDGVPINQSNQSKSFELITDESLSWKALIREISKKSILCRVYVAGRAICFKAHRNKNTQRSYRAIL